MLKLRKGDMIFFDPPPGSGRAAMFHKGNKNE